MSSPTRKEETSLALNGEDPNSVEMERHESTVAKLKRLASSPNYRKSTQLSPTALDTQKNGADINDIRVSATGEAASKIQDLVRRSSVSRADIRKFIEKEFHKSSASKELLRHLIFLVILIAGVTLHRSAYESYLMNQALLTSFVTQQIDFDLQPFPKTFLDVGQPDEFVDWFLSVLGGTLDTTTFYNDQNMTEEQRNYIMFSNRLIGGVRVRQQRVAANRGCKAPHQLIGLSQGTCYSWDYSGSTRDVEPFGPPEDPNKYTYQTEKETGSVGFFGYILNYLDGGGYVVDVNIEDRLNGTSYTEKFQELIDDLWIDRQTRAVIITMIFVNLELESRVGVIYLIIEIPGDGVFFPSVMIKTFRLDLYVTALDYFRMALEILFFIFVVYSIYCEISEMISNHRTRHSGGKGLKKYFYNGWNILELVDIVLYIVVIVLYVKYLASPERYQAKLQSTMYSSDMERLASIALAFYNVLSINVILTTFRTFKYLKLNHRLYLLWKTLRHAGVDLLGFLFIFLVFIFGFIFMGWLAFGPDITGFNTFVHSFATCWNFIIGNAPDYDAMFASNRIIGPLFFVLFTIFIFFILANMFIAILSNSFEVVNENSDEQAKLKDIFEEKVKEVASVVRKFYYTLTKKDMKARPITEILDNLARPEILDRPNLSRSDIAKAIGENATEFEIDELHQWIKRMEKRTSYQTRRFRNSGGAGLMADFAEDDDEKDVSKSLVGKKSREIPPPSPASSSSNSDDTKIALKEMQAQMVELKQLIHRLSSRDKDTNNNNFI